MIYALKKLIVLIATSATLLSCTTRVPDVPSSGASLLRVVAELSNLQDLRNIYEVEALLHVDLGSKIVVRKCGRETYPDSGMFVYTLQPLWLSTLAGTSSELQATSRGSKNTLSTIGSPSIKYYVQKASCREHGASPGSLLSEVDFSDIRGSTCISVADITAVMPSVAPARGTVDAAPTIVYEGHATNNVSTSAEFWMASSSIHGAQFACLGSVYVRQLRVRR